MRISFVMDDELLFAVDECASDLHLSRGAFLRQAAALAVEAQRFKKAQPDLVAKMNEISEMVSKIAPTAN